jgi:hypothetical protein
MYDSVTGACCQRYAYGGIPCCWDDDNYLEGQYLPNNNIDSLFTCHEFTITYQSGDCSKMGVYNCRPWFLCADFPYPNLICTVTLTCSDTKVYSTSLSVSTYAYNS